MAVGEDEASCFIHNKSGGIGTAGSLGIKGASLRHLEHHNSPHHSLQRLAPGVARHLAAGEERQEEGGNSKKARGRCRLHWDWKGQVPKQRASGAGSGGSGGSGGRVERWAASAG